MPLFIAPRRSPRTLGAVALAACVALLMAAASAQAAYPGTNGKIAVTNFTGSTEVFTLNSDGSAFAALTTGANAAQGGEWSPDGAHIAYSRTVGGNRDIYIANADGTGETRLTTSVDDQAGPTFSPDGKQIAYISKVGSDDN